MARLVKAGDFVGPGEERAAAYLETNLPDSWIVVCNKELVRPASVREVDFIVVGIHCLFAIEEKYWWGPIHGNENGWILSGGESLASPLRQAEDVGKRLAGFLRENVPTLKDHKGGKFVFSRVLLSHDNVQVFVDDPRVHSAVLRLEGCAEDLIRFDDQQANVLSIFTVRDEIAKRLTSLPNRPEVPKQVGSYHVKEVLDPTGAIRCLRAVHDDGTERILKLVPQPVTADPAHRDDLKRALLREYDALRKLSATGRVPLVDPYFSWDQDQFWVFPLHPIPARSLRADAADALPEAERIWTVAQESFSALSDVHRASVVHRGINPDRVFVGQDERVAFSDFLIARISDELTIAGEIEEVDVGNAYRAPECARDTAKAEERSDVYSLALSLLSWITGSEADSVEGTGMLEPLRGDLDETTRQFFTDFFARCLNPSANQRPWADEAASLIDESRPKVSRAPVDSLSDQELAPGQLVENQYEIIRRLGQGATAITYLAKDIVADTQFVLKTITNAELVSRLSRAEFRFLMDLHHPHLPRVFDVRPPESLFHIKLEYIRGSPLRELSAQYRGNVGFCIRVGEAILEALAYLGQSNRIHRDVSPGNIVIPDEETGNVALVDFGLSTAELETKSAVGTPRYRAPEVERGGTWTPTSDLYSLGVVLFELLTGRLPYKVESGAAIKEELVQPSEEEAAVFGDRLLRILLTASSPDPATRFQTAEEFLLALRGAAIPDPTSQVTGVERINPTVEALRGVYRNSRIGNADNRGLDSAFAEETYVATRLDEELLPDLIQGKFQLLILSGNPGDGKTAFLQRLRMDLVAAGARIESESEAGWRMKLKDRTFISLYDASESEGDRTADELLHDVLAPFRGYEFQEGYTVAIAANDGRLFDFFERTGALTYPKLWEELRRQLNESTEPLPGILIVDLKGRSLVGLAPKERSVSDRIVDEFTASQRWQICEDCVARTECPMRLNALSWTDATLGGQARKQLHRIILAVHLRRQQRATLRDLRSALAFLITHDLGCEEVHGERRNGKWPIADSSRLYFSAAFDGSGLPDLLLGEWANLDPAMVPTPRLDRFLHFHRRGDMEHKISDIILHGSVRPMIPVSAEQIGPEEWITYMKRRYFFEGAMRPDNQDLEGLSPPAELLPYRHFDKFVQALSSVDNDKSLLAELLLGMSRIDGVPEAAAADALSLTASVSAQEDLIVIKRFPFEEFELARPRQVATYTERIEDQLLLRHKSGAPVLFIGLDLYELLERAREGVLPGAEEHRALIEDLGTFKNQLLARPTAEVMVVEGGQIAHDIVVRDNVIVREGGQR